MNPTIQMQAKSAIFQILVLCSAFSSATAQPAYSPGQILIRFRTAAAKTAVGSLESLHLRFAAGTPEPVFQPPAVPAKRALGLAQVYRLEIDPGASPVEAAAAYTEHPDVVYAQPIHLFYHHDAPNDPRLPDQYGLDQIRWQALRDGLPPEEQPVVIAIIDSGVDYTHEDLADNIWINTVEASGRPGVDDDNNGYVDDVRGWDFTHTPTLPAKGDYLSPDNDPMDESSHGTRVAGIAAAVTDNGLGIAGVAPDAALMSLRAGVTLQSNLTFLEEDDLAAAILYAVENGAHIINMSWGGPESAFLIRDAVRYAAGSGLVLVSSAGNSGEFGLSYPAAMDETIAVGATAPQDRIAAFSSLGVPLDLVAPGSGTLTTMPGNRYAHASGTSFAAPHVAGLTALILSRRPDLTREQVRTLLTASVIDLGPEGWDSSSGAGRIDAAILLEKTTGWTDPPVVQIDHPRTDDGARRNVDILARADGPNVAGYELFSGRGEDPQSWNRLSGGPPGSNIRHSWTPGTPADTTAILRLRVRLTDGTTLEDRVRIGILRALPVISKASFAPILIGNRQAYQAEWHTRRPTRGALLYRSSTATREDTLFSDIIYTRHRVTLPPDIPPGPLDYRIMSRDAGGQAVFSEPLTLRVDPLRLSSRGFVEIDTLPDGYLANETADFDMDGRPELVLMPYASGHPYNTNLIVERDENGNFTTVFRTNESFLPWALGDANNDGRTDLLGINFPRTNIARLRLFVGTPFPSETLMDRPEYQGGEIVDVDGDGQNEIVALSALTGDIRVFESTVEGVFIGGAPLANPTEGTNWPGLRLVVADLNGNGRKEILSGDDDGDLWIYGALPGGGFAQTWKLAGSDSTNTQWIGGGADIDNDGDVEFAVARAAEDRNDALNGRWNLEIYSEDGLSSYALEWSIRVSGVISTGNGIATGDVDGNGIPDLAVCLRPDLYLIRATGPDAYEPVWHETVSLTYRPLIADLDRDGYAELLYNRDGAVRLMERTEPGISRILQIVHAYPLGPESARLAWAPVESGATYRILRGVDGSMPEAIADKLTTNSYTDIGLAENRVYRYVVIATLPGGDEISSETHALRPNPAPELHRVEVIHENSLSLEFSEPMSAGTANPNGYSVTPDLGRPTSVILDRTSQRAMLSFSVPFEAGRKYTLACSMAADSSGVPLASGYRNVSFTSGQTTFPSAGIADFDGSGRVDFSDFLLFASAFGSTDPRFDLDDDGNVAFSDFVRFALLFGKVV
ncbi:MAG: S8 family serine peptidase [Gemmatimonadetes bacterium]|nr:S8 family serine peptidase [Gemmatimonadota bacterium]